MKIVAAKLIIFMETSKFSVKFCGIFIRKDGTSASLVTVECMMCVCIIKTYENISYVCEFISFVYVGISFVYAAILVLRI